MHERPIVIAVSGDPGSGKSTVCERLAADLSLTRVYAGGTFRALAAERGMTLAAFEEYAATHEDIDFAVDEAMRTAGRAGNALLEGRMSAWVARAASIPALCLYLRVSPEAQAVRIQERDGGTLDDALRHANERQASDVARLRSRYGVDFTDPHWYDAIIDTSLLDREGVYRAVLKEVARYRDGAER